MSCTVCMTKSRHLELVYLPVVIIDERSIVALHHLCSKEIQTFDLDLNDKKKPKGFEFWTIENGPETYRDSFWDPL